MSKIKAVIFDMYETLITQYKSPVYFGTQMAQDAEIEKSRFLEVWDVSENDRTIGRMTFEEAIEETLKKNGQYSQRLAEEIAQKRVAAKKECFNQLDSEIIPMFDELKKRGVLIGLISNCFSEEVGVIKESALYSYFDAAMLSFEQKIAKPDSRIFENCMTGLNVTAGECLYVGDGGSGELEAAEKLGMTALQAVWYFKYNTKLKLYPNYAQLDKPKRIFEYL